MPGILRKERKQGCLQNGGEAATHASAQCGPTSDLDVSGLWLIRVFISPCYTYSKLKNLEDKYLSFSHHRDYQYPLLEFHVVQSFRLELRFVGGKSSLILGVRGYLRSNSIDNRWKPS
jgi:hypothetical protein